MNLILLGAPGSGKGTQASLLSEKFKIPHISTGDILRAAIAANTDLGKRARGYMNKGELVPDKVVIGIIKDRLRQPDAAKGFLLDGFPRTVVQAEALDKELEELSKKIDAVIDIEVSEDEIIRRLTGRRVCADCQEVYHLFFEPPENEDYCDVCGGRLVQRPDDRLETVKRRLKVYKEQTAPLIEYYGRKKLLRSVNGQQEVEDVFADIARVIKGDYE